MKSSTSKAATIALAVAAAIGLAACGGGDKHVYGGFDTPPPAPAPTPAPVVDSFFAALLKIVGAAPDDTEADQSAFDALVATSPDDTEPQPLG